MRIAILYAWDGRSSVGGIQNYVRFMQEQLVNRGHEVQIFLPRFADDSSSRPGLSVSSERGTLIDLGRRPTLMRFTLPGRLGSLVSTFLNRLTFNVRAGQVVHEVLLWKPDIVWQQDLTSSFRAISLIREHAAIALTNHTGEYILLNRFWPSRLLLRWFLRRYDTIIGPSDELTPRLPQATFIPNGADPILCAPADTERRAQLRENLLGVGPNIPTVVICPRRWAPTKGVLTFVEALRQLGSRDDIIAVFAGDEETEYPNYVRAVESKLKSVQVPFVRLGSIPLDRLVDYYQAADLTVIPSILEATSLAAVESMLVGVPVLATAVGGMPALIEDGVTGFLVPPEDPRSLAQRLNDVLSDPELRFAVSARGRAFALRGYTWGALAEETEKHLTMGHDAARIRLPYVD